MSIPQPLRKFRSCRATARRTMRSTRTILAFIAATIVCSAGISCKKDNPVTPPSTPAHTAITFQVTFTSTRWCRLQWTNDSTSASHHYVLIRDGRDTLYNDSMAASVAVKVLQDSVLKPGTSYSYWVYRIVNGQRWDSATVSVRTLDTTKDNYTWETIRVSGAGATLYGISGDSPNSIWICGGFGIGGYHNNVVHVVNGVPNYRLVGLGDAYYGCYAVSDTSIYFVTDGIIVHYSGTVADNHIFNGDSLPRHLSGPGSIWVAPDDRELFAVGGGRTIIHRKSDGKTWELLDPGIPSNFELLQVLAFSSDDIYFTAGTADPGDGMVVHYDGSTWTTVAVGKIPQPDSTTLRGGFWDISGSNGDSLVVVGFEAYHRRRPGWQKITPANFATQTLMEGVDARQWNNVWIAGDFGELLKWDGEKWIHYPQFIDHSANLILGRIRAFSNEVYVIGADDNGAVILHGR